MGQERHGTDEVDDSGNVLDQELDSMVGTFIEYIETEDGEIYFGLSDGTGFSFAVKDEELYMRRFIHEDKLKGVH